MFVGTLAWFPVAGTAGVWVPFPACAVVSWVGAEAAAEAAAAEAAVGETVVGEAGAAVGEAMAEAPVGEAAAGPVGWNGVKVAPAEVFPPVGALVAVVDPPLLQALSASIRIKTNTGNFGAKRARMIFPPESMPIKLYVSN